jgi:hypothetical protein
VAVGWLETGRWFLITTAELVVLFLALSFLVGLLKHGCRRRGSAGCSRVAAPSPAASWGPLWGQ